MAWTAEEKGTVLVTDLRGSTRHILGLGGNDAIEGFFNGPFEEYCQQLLEILRGELGAEVAAVRGVKDTGDGFAAVVASERAVPIAGRLQQACDAFSASVLPAALKEGEELPFCFATAIGAATDLLLATAQPRGGLDAAPEGFPPCAFTGPVFNEAARIADKARPRRAVLSPLFDRATAEACTGPEWFTFFVGDFEVDTKGSFEVPLPPLEARDRDEGENRRWVPLFSAVPKGSPALYELAQNLKGAVSYHFEGRRAKALEAYSKLASRLRELAPEVEREAGSLALRRWRDAVRHFSYLPYP